MHEATDPRPLALLVTRNFPPLLGGMEKVNQQLLAALAATRRTALCGPAGCADHVPPQTEVRQSAVKPLALFLVVTLWHAVALAWRRRPQWVIAGSGLTAPIAWLAARITGGRVAVYLHGLDIVAPSWLYQRLWLPFIRCCDLVLVNSTHTSGLAKQRGVRPDVTHVLHPGCELPTLDAESADCFREKHKFGQRPLLLSVGRLTQRKGLVEFVTSALPAIVAAEPDVLLAVIGEEASDALHVRAGSERERILAAARAAGTAKNIRFLGRCDEATLAAAYQASDVHVFPVLDLPGDVEGFGMVALEAAAHGLRTVAFAVGGVPDAVQDGRTGTLVEPRNYAAFSGAALVQLAQARRDAAIIACREFAADKAWPAFDQRLRSLLTAASV